MLGLEVVFHRGHLLGHTAPRAGVVFPELRARRESGNEVSISCRAMRLRTFVFILLFSF